MNSILQCCTRGLERFIAGNERSGSFTPLVPQVRSQFQLNHSQLPKRANGSRMSRGRLVAMLVQAGSIPRVNLVGPVVFKA